MPRGITIRNTSYRPTILPIKSLHTRAVGVRAAEGIHSDSIRKLAESIAETGIIEPIVVRPVDGDQFQVIAGERRLLAARSLDFSEVPCVLANCSESEGMMIFLTENLVRSDLNPIEKAVGISKLLEEFQLSQEEIGMRIGMSQSAIAHHLRLLALPGDIQRLMESGDLSMGHGKALAGVKDDKKMIALARKCVAEKWSVRELELSASRTLKVVGRGQVGDISKKRRQELELPNGVFLVIKQSGSQPSAGIVEIPYYSEGEKEWLVDVLSRA